MTPMTRTRFAAAVALLFAAAPAAMAQKDAPKEDDRPGRGEMPRAGIGWQLTAAPRDFGGEGRGRGGPRRGPGGPRGPGGRSCVGP